MRTIRDSHRMVMPSVSPSPGSCGERRLTRSERELTEQAKFVVGPMVWPADRSVGRCERTLLGPLALVDESEVERRQRFVVEAEVEVAILECWIDYLARLQPVIAAEGGDLGRERKRSERRPAIGLITRSGCHAVPVLRREVFDASADAFVGVSGNRVEALGGVRSGAVRQVRSALAELARVPADAEGDVLLRIDADPSLEVDRVRVARQGLEPGTVDGRGGVADDTVRKRAADMHAPVRRSSEARPVDQRILDEAVAVETLDERSPRQRRFSDADKE